MYSMRELEQITKKSSVAIRKLMKTNEELKSIVERETVKEKRFVKYSESALQFLLKYYNCAIEEKESVIVDSVVAEDSEEKSIEEIKSTPPTDELLIETQKRVEALQEENAQQKKRIIELEKEINELIAQNSQLLLLLSQEKQEKQLLLAESNKTFVDRIKRLFVKTK